MLNVFMKKRAGKKRVKKKVSKSKRILFLQAVATLIIAVYIIMTSLSTEKTVTGNVISSSSGTNVGETTPYKIFIFLGIAIGIFSFIEIVILLIVTYM
jgi:hypothetical protein